MDDLFIKKKSLRRIKKHYKEDIELFLLKVMNRPENNFKEYEESILDWTTQQSLNSEEDYEPWKNEKQKRDR